MRTQIRWRDFYPVALFVVCLMGRTLVGTTQPKVSMPPPNIWAQLRMEKSDPKACSPQKLPWKSERSCPREHDPWPKPAPSRYASGTQSNFHLVRNN